MNWLLRKYKLWRAERRFNKGYRNPMPPNMVDCLDNKGARKILRRWQKNKVSLVVSGVIVPPGLEKILGKEVSDLENKMDGLNNTYNPNNQFTRQEIYGKTSNYL